MRKISFHSRITEVNTLAGQTINLHNKYADQIQDENLTKMVSELEVMYNAQTLAIKREMSKSEMDVLDEAVNNSVRSFFKIIEGYTYHPNEAIKNSALTVNQILSKYGLGMIYENVPTQTALVDSMLKDLANTDNAVWEQLSGCKDLIGVIEAAQVAIKSGNIENKQKQQAASNIPSASELRLDILRFMNTQLCKYLEVMTNMNPDRFRVFTETLEKLIDSNNQMVDQRAAKEEKAE